MNATADKLTERQDPAARLVARLRELSLKWEEDAHEITRAAPDATAAFSRCGKELAAALVKYSTETERTGTA